MKPIYQIQYAKTIVGIPETGHISSIEARFTRFMTSKVEEYTSGLAMLRARAFSAKELCEILREEGEVSRVQDQELGMDSVTAIFFAGKEVYRLNESQFICIEPDDSALTLVNTEPGGSVQAHRSTGSLPFFTRMVMDLLMSQPEGYQKIESVLGCDFRKELREAVRRTVAVTPIIIEFSDAKFTEMRTDAIPLLVYGKDGSVELRETDRGDMVYRIYIRGTKYPKRVHVDMPKAVKGSVLSGARTLRRFIRSLSGGHAYFIADRFRREYILVSKEVLEQGTR